jgi:hypothetical protein
LVCGRGSSNQTLAKKIGCCPQELERKRTDKPTFDRARTFLTTHAPDPNFRLGAISASFRMCSDHVFSTRGFLSCVTPNRNARRTRKASPKPSSDPSLWGRGKFGPNLKLEGTGTARIRSFGAFRFSAAALRIPRRLISSHPSPRKARIRISPAKRLAGSQQRGSDPNSPGCQKRGHELRMPTESSDLHFYRTLQVQVRIGRVGTGQMEVHAGTKNPKLGSVVPGLNFHTKFASAHPRP